MSYVNVPNLAARNPAGGAGDMKHLEARNVIPQRVAPGPEREIQYIVPHDF